MRAPSLPSVFQDEDGDEFEDDGVSAGGNADIPDGAPRWERPNGQTYVSRYIGAYQDVPFIRHCRNQQEHVLLVGPPGTGKTAVVGAAFAQDAARIPATDLAPEHAHQGYYSIVCTVDTTEGDFVGSYVQDPATGRFRWSPGPLMLALLDNVPLFVDEVLLADPRVLASCLYPLMDGSGWLRVAANPDLPPLAVPDRFFVLGAGNPDVPGANMSDALRSRFTHHIEVGTDWALARQLGAPAWIVRIAKALDADRQEGLGDWAPQLRELLAFRDANEQYGTAFAVNGLISKAPLEGRDALIAALAAAKETEGFKLRPLRMGAQKPGRL